MLSRVIATTLGMLFLRHSVQQNRGSILIKIFKILVVYRSNKNNVSTTTADINK